MTISWVTCYSYLYSVMAFAILTILIILPPPFPLLFLDFGILDSTVTHCKNIPTACFPFWCFSSFVIQDGDLKFDTFHASQSSRDDSGSHTGPL